MLRLRARLAPLGGGTAHGKHLVVRLVVPFVAVLALLETGLFAVRAGDATSLVVVGLVVALAVPARYFLGRTPVPADVLPDSLDRLTGLLDDRSFQDALHEEVVRAQFCGEPFTVVLMDVDDFRSVNHDQGHHKGDDVLVNLAAALRTGRSMDHPFRVGGDEFAVIMPQTGLDDAVTAVERFRKAALLTLGGTTISVGLALFDPNSIDTDVDTDAAVLRERVDLALCEAKRRGRNQAVTFRDIVARGPSCTPATLFAVRDLLAGGRMGAAFQPIWNLETYQVFGYEGLARPAQEYGLAGPLEAFLGAARLGRVAELDALCRRAILARARDLPDDVLLFLNIAPEVFEYGGQSGKRLREEVEAAGLRPQRVVIELNENASDRMGPAIAHLPELRGIGFRLALDGAGAGDGGLGLLGTIRPDYVKVDRGVVSSARDGGPGRSVLAAIVAYATQTGAIVIAEGIESGEMLHLVRAARTGGQRAQFLGGQGYLLGRPDVHPQWQHASALWPLPGQTPEPSEESRT